MEAHPNRTVILLGPQRLTPTLVNAVRGAGVEGDVAVVTAGWQEREEEVDELVRGEVVGDEPCEMLDFGEFGDYAKR